MQTQKSMELKNRDSSTLARFIARVLIEKKGVDVKVFDVREKSSITDFYVNVTGRSSTHVSSLADELSYEVGLLGRDPLHTEGRAGQSWVLVDYADVIVNIFDRQSRDFYSFDRNLPAEGLVDLSSIIAEIDSKYGADN